MNLPKNEFFLRICSVVNVSNSHLDGGHTFRIHKLNCEPRTSSVYPSNRGRSGGGPRVCLPCIQDGGKKWPLSLSGLSAPYRELSQSAAIGADLSVGNLVDAKSNN